MRLRHAEPRSDWINSSDALNHDPRARQRGCCAGSTGCLRDDGLQPCDVSRLGFLFWEDGRSEPPRHELVNLVKLQKLDERSPKLASEMAWRYSGSFMASTDSGYGPAGTTPLRPAETRRLPRVGRGLRRRPADFLAFLHRSGRPPPGRSPLRSRRHRKHAGGVEGDRPCA